MHNVVHATINAMVCYELGMWFQSCAWGNELYSSYMGALRAAHVHEVVHNVHSFGHVVFSSLIFKSVICGIHFSLLPRIIMPF